MMKYLALAALVSQVLAAPAHIAVDVNVGDQGGSENYMPLGLA